MSDPSSCPPFESYVCEAGRGDEEEGRECCSFIVDTPPLQHLRGIPQALKDVKCVVVTSRDGIISERDDLVLTREERDSVSFLLLHVTLEGFKSFLLLFCFVF